MFGRILKYLSVYEEPSEDASDSDIIQEKTEEELAEEKSLIETANVLRELRMTVQKLRLETIIAHDNHSRLSYIPSRLQ